MKSNERFDESVRVFRLASREMFNHYFKLDNPYENDGWGLLERFLDVEKVLFQKLVAEPAELKKCSYGMALDDVYVRVNTGNSVPILINRDMDSGYWDYPVNSITDSASLKFSCFFDWDHLAYRDHQYVRVRIVDWPDHPDAVGKNALLESTYARFSKR